MKIKLKTNTTEYLWHIDITSTSSDTFWTQHHVKSSFRRVCCGSHSLLLQSFSLISHCHFLPILFILLLHSVLSVPPEPCGCLFVWNSLFIFSIFYYCCHSSFCSLSFFILHACHMSSRVPGWTGLSFGWAASLPPHHWGSNTGFIPVISSCTIYGPVYHYCFEQWTVPPG